MSELSLSLSLSRMQSLGRMTILVVIFLIVFAPVKASANQAQICDAAAAQASRSTGVPVAVLRAISLTETGRNKNGSFDPWPWTVNMEGKGVWFDTQVEALKYAKTHFARGARSFDVGCFQLNYRWHGQAFQSVEHMFEPVANAMYAAEFLRSLYSEKGNWVDAAGAYHSRTPKYANKYKARFARIVAQLEGSPAPSPIPVTQPTAHPQAVQVTQTATRRPNLFPLLHGNASAQANLGSLFPTSAGNNGQRLIGGN